MTRTEDGGFGVGGVSYVGLVTLSSAALLVVLSAAGPALIRGVLPPLEQDEGVRAHIFQLCIVCLAPTGLAFLAAADWSRPARIAWRLAVPFALTVTAFALLYWLEHAPR